jgi:hypothetical protein
MRSASSAKTVQLLNASDAVLVEHDPEKWEPVFGKRSCSNKKLDHDPDST